MRVAKFLKVITTVQCSVCSQLNNKPRVVVTDVPYLHGFTKWLAYLQRTPRRIIIRVGTNTPTKFMSACTTHIYIADITNVP